MKTTTRQRAYILSQIISEKIWGGEHGWEYADNGQFQSLKTQARLLVRSDLYEAAQARIKELEAALNETADAIEKDYTFGLEEIYANKLRAIAGGKDETNHI